ncbi:MAG: adenosine kinase [Lentisphaeria bacterium]
MLKPMIHSITPRLLGFGAALLDEMIQVEEAFVAVLPGKKGGAQQVSASEMSSLLAGLPGKPLRQLGGATANTIRAYVGLGGQAGMLTLVGDDEAGMYYQQAMRNAKVAGEGIKVIPGGETGCCLSLVTPDSERTMRTRQGIADQMKTTDFTAADFQGYTHLFVEGYALYTPEVLRSILSSGHAAGLQIAYDAGSPELVAAHRDLLGELLSEYVSIAFFNEEESTAFCNSRDPVFGLQSLSQCCELAVVKAGKDGAYVSEAGSPAVHIPAFPANALDTTGAGDFWAAGFLYGWLNGASLAEAGAAAARLAAAVVEQVGTEMLDEFWRRLSLASFGDTLNKEPAYKSKF